MCVAAEKDDHKDSGRKVPTERKFQLMLSWLETRTPRFGKRYSMFKSHIGEMFKSDNGEQGSRSAR